MAKYTVCRRLAPANLALLCCQDALRVLVVVGSFALFGFLFFWSTTRKLLLFPGFAPKACHLPTASRPRPTFIGLGIGPDQTGPDYWNTLDWT